MFTPDSARQVPVAGSTSKPSSFTGMCPWSWYIATTASNCRARSLTNTVSPGTGPLTSIPSARHCSTTGVVISMSCRPNSPPSPACGFSAATATRGFGMPEIAHRRMCEVDGAAQPLWRQQLRHVGQRDMRGDVAHPHVAVRQQHHRTARLGQRRQHVGVAGIVVAGEVQRLLVQRCGDDGIDPSRQRQFHRARHREIGEAPCLRRDLADRRSVPPPRRPQGRPAARPRPRERQGLVQQRAAPRAAPSDGRSPAGATRPPRSAAAAGGTP